MPSNVQAGTILIQNQALIAGVLGLESEPFSDDWRKVNELDALALDRKIHAAGWNFFSGVWCGGGKFSRTVSD